MIAKLLGKLVGTVVGEDAGKDVIAYFDTKQKLKQELKLAKLSGKIAVETAKAQYRADQLRQHGEWSKGMVSQMSGWKDEFVLIVVSLPLLGAMFWPERTLEVFSTLEKTPTWYQYMLITIFLAIYGLKPAFKKLGFWK